MKKNISILLFLAVFTLAFSNSSAESIMKKPGLEKGNQIPDFILIDLNGKKSNIKEYRGKTVLLNFWATWCPPCRAEMPSMEKLYKTYKEKNFVILAVSVDDAPTAEVASFIKSNKYTFPVFHDADGTLARKFLIRSIPTTYVLDKNGIITDKIIGAKDWSSFIPKD